MKYTQQVNDVSTTIEGTLAEVRDLLDFLDKQGDRIIDPDIGQYIKERWVKSDD